MVRVLRWTSCAAGVALGATVLAQPPALGRITFPTSGSAAAQRPFVRGVLLLHSFEYDDAIDAFREAERLDPAFVMAYWGEAMCYNQPLWYNENLDKARAALARLAPTPAARAQKAPAGREKAYLAAVERLFGDGDKPTRDREYAALMAALARQYPTDDEAAAFYALSLLGTISPGDRHPETSLEAGAIAAAILERNPQHPGAAHYSLHAYDDGEHAAMGLDAARIYATIAPASSHARHMPSHVFLPLGMWDDAARADASAFAASVDLVKRKGMSEAQWDFHSLGWLQYEYLQQGRFVKARELIEMARRGTGDHGVTGSARGSDTSRTDRRAVGSRGSRGSAASNSASSANPPHPAHAQNPMNPASHFQSEIGRGFGPMSLSSEIASMRARLVIESGDWGRMKQLGSFDNIDELFALGLSSVHLGDFARAEAAIEHLDTAVKTIPDRDASEISAIMSAELTGVLRLARKARAGGKAALARAVALEAARPRPIARPYPIKPAAELSAEALLADGDATEAVRQFRMALARTPNRAASLLGLARAARAAGMRQEAVRAARAFVAMWHLADPGRPELKAARAIITGG